MLRIVVSVEAITRRASGIRAADFFIQSYCNLYHVHGMREQFRWSPAEVASSVFEPKPSHFAYEEAEPQISLLEDTAGNVSHAQYDPVAQVFQCVYCTGWRSTDFEQKETEPWISWFKDAACSPSHVHEGDSLQR